MSSTLHVVLSTGTAEAKLFFCVAQQAAEFTESNYERRRRFSPSFIIYQETLYKHKGVRIASGDVGNHFYREQEILSLSEFHCLFWMILDENEAFEKKKERLVKIISEELDNQAARFSYNIWKHHSENSTLVTGLEKRLIDNLNIPGLESALREAVKRENFEAAAYIRDRIQAEDYVIVEEGSQLYVRLLKEELARFINHLPPPK